MSRAQSMMICRRPSSRVVVRTWVLGLRVGVILTAATVGLCAQGRDTFLSRAHPTLPFQLPEPAKYNLKWGSWKGRLKGSVTAEFNDNINLASVNRQSDFYLGPEVGIGLFYPISHRNLLSLDLGVGYRWYLQHSELSTFHISPDTHIDYRFWVKDVQINVHDDFRVQIDPTSRPELSGSVFNYRRFINNAGVDFTGQPVEPFTWTTGYNFTLDRTLNSEFESLDRNAHTFNAGAYYELSPRWTSGVFGAYTLNDYTRRIQNNNTGWSAGPTLVFKPSDFVVLDGSVLYTRHDYRNSGTISDTSDFEGMTFQAGVRHTINSKMNHSLRVRRSIELGLTSNFTDTYSTQYELQARLTAALTLDASVAYQNFKVSGAGGEEGSQYLVFLGTHLNLTPNWVLGLGYTLALKESDQSGRDYTQNRVTAELTRMF